MFIETTTHFKDALEARDSFEGLKTLPYFYFGYVRLNADDSADVVTVCECSDLETTETTRTLRGQKRVVMLSTGAANDTLLGHATRALQPFADMDREECDLTEVACERGVASDLTIITSRDFREARLTLEKLSTNGGF